MRKSRPDGAALLVAAGFLVLGVWLAIRFQQRINPDGISYLAVARHVLAGRTTDAVNGYWGPLLSWLLVPALAAGAAPLVAARLVGLASGLLALWGAMRLAATAGLGRGATVALLLALTPALAVGATVAVTPDLLFLGLWLHYLALVHRPGFGSRRADAPVAGLLGALGYLAKPYGFYAFALHFLLCGLWRLATAAAPARRRVLATTAVGFAVFAVCAAPWIAALGAKYGGLPISTSGPYNRALFGPASQGQPLEHLGFVPPPGEFATSAWEDPTGLPLATWSPFDGAAAMRHQLKLSADNARRLLLAVAHANYLGLLALPAAAFLVVRARRRGSWLPEAYLIAAMVVYPAGYLLVRVEPRYVWVSVVAGIVATMLTAERLTRGRGRLATAALLAAAVLGCWTEPARTLRAGDAQTPVVSATVAALAADVVPGARLAADDRWIESLAVAYRLGARFHGVRGGLDAAAAERGLADQGVEWYLDWSRDGTGTPPGPGWSPFGPAAARGGPRIWRASAGVTP